MTTISFFQRQRRLSSLSCPSSLLIYSFTHRSHPSSTLTAALTELDLPPLFPNGSLTATNKPSQRSQRSIQALCATAIPAQKNSQGDFTHLPPRSGPRYQIIQHAPAPCQFGSTSVYFQRNLIWLLRVHFPHNSSRAVCMGPREAVLRLVPLNQPVARASTKWQSSPGRPTQQGQLLHTWALPVLATGCPAGQLQRQILLGTVRVTVLVTGWASYPAKL